MDAGSDVTAAGVDEDWCDAYALDELACGSVVQAVSVAAPYVRRWASLLAAL